MTILCNTKEVFMRFGHLTKINSIWIYHANCNEQWNEALDIVGAEVKQEDDAYFQNYGTTIAGANYEVQMKPSKPLIIVRQNHVKTNVLSVYALRSHVRISQDLMLCVTLHVGYSRTNTLPVAKISALVELAMRCSPENLRGKPCTTILSYRASWDTLPTLYSWKQKASSE
eukprot:4945255-Ditylum_brightwellii.AAC.1